MCLVIVRVHRGRIRMVVGFTATYAISAYHLTLRIRIPLMVRCTRYNII